MLPLVVGDGFAEAIVWPGMGATHRSLHRFVLAGGASTVAMRHESEAVYHVNSGRVVAVDIDDDEAHALHTGSMIHITPGTTYRIEALEDAEVIGGPCPPDPSLYSHLPPTTI